MTSPVRSKPFAIVGALVAYLVLAAPAVAGNGGFAPVEPDSPNAEGITHSYWFITAFILAIFALVEGLLIAFIVRFRRRRGRARDEDAPQIHGATRLETMWTIGPVLVLFAIAAFVFAKLPGIRDVPSATAAGGRLDVTVSGRQYYWEFRYPNGVIAVDRLRAPASRSVELTVTAPDFDVIHSWWIPALGGKLDAIPGRENRTWFRAERTGISKGRCAELCGLEHATMLAEVEVMPQAEFDAWLDERARQQAEGTSPLGEETYDGACAKCHGLAGEGGYGPALAGSSLTQDPDAIATLLENGRNLMPAVGRDWEDVQMDALTSYLGERFKSGG